MKYNNYRLRRQIIADGGETWMENPLMKVVALAIVEYTDWNTGEKPFQNKQHFENWLRHMATVNNIQPVNSNLSPWVFVQMTVKYMEQKGYATLDKTEKVLRLHQLPDWDDEAQEASQGA